MISKKTSEELLDEFNKNVREFFRDYILIELPDVCCWVAGGALRDFYLYGYIKGETDIDIFTTCEENYFKIVEALKEFYDVDRESTWAITFTDKNDKEKIVQVIKKFYDTPTHTLQNFDLTCCCACIKKDGEGIALNIINHFFNDNYNRRLKFLQLNKDPNTTLGRIEKYIKKGFKIEDEELLGVIKSYLNGNTNFAELETSYKGLQIKN